MAKFPFNEEDNMVMQFFPNRRVPRDIVLHPLTIIHINATHISRFEFLQLKSLKEWCELVWLVEATSFNHSNFIFKYGLF